MIKRHQYKYLVSYTCTYKDDNGNDCRMFSTWEKTIYTHMYKKVSEKLMEECRKYIQNRTKDKYTVIILSITQIA